MARAQGRAEILVDVESEAVRLIGVPNLLPLWEKDTETCELAR
jgi:hypothetical protein